MTMLKIKWLGLIILTTLGITACGGASKEITPEPTAVLPEEPSLTTGIEFRPINEIIDRNLEVTNFANDGSATLPIHTSIPVACTVVYGTTPAFGSLTLDQDMAGGTHSDHNPLLSGLAPETTYFFRAQGVDDKGVVYLSEVMTFTTPPQDTSQGPENLASPLLGAEITGVSSAFGGAGTNDRWGAGSAFDDNPNTEWSSAGDGNNAWIEVTLANPARIKSVEFRSRSMSDGSAIASAFTVTTETGDEFGPFDLSSPDQAFTFEVAIEAQVLRFNLVDTSGGNTGIVDIAVFGEFLDG